MDIQVINEKKIFTVTKSIYLCILQVFLRHQWMESISSDFMLMLILLRKWQSVSIKMISSSALYFLRSPFPMLMAAMVLFSHCRRVMKCTHSCGRTAGFMTMETATLASAVFCFSLCECPQNPELDEFFFYATSVVMLISVWYFPQKEENIVWSPKN